MLEVADTATVTISVMGIELIALKKLSLVSHLLAKKVDGYQAQQEQKVLADTLDGIIRKIEIAAAGG